MWKKKREVKCGKREEEIREVWGKRRGEKLSVGGEKRKRREEMWEKEERREVSCGKREEERRRGNVKRYERIYNWKRKEKKNGNKLKSNA